MSVLRTAAITFALLVGMVTPAMASRDSTPLSFTERVQVNAGQVPSSSTKIDLCCSASSSEHAVPGLANGAFPDRVQASWGALPTENQTSCQAPVGTNRFAAASESFPQRIQASSGQPSAYVSAESYG